jgi:hypothetical protein
MRRKLIPLAAAAVLAGCGGGGAAAPKTVSGEGFTFEAPSSWRVVHNAGTASARSEGALLSVTAIGLRRAFRPALWPQVVPELDRVAAEFAQRERGRVTASRTVLIRGRRARQYDIDAPGARERVTFLLVGRREYQLLCTNAEDDCDAFLASFRLT